MLLFNKEKRIVFAMVEFSVKEIFLYNIYGRCLRCQCVVTVSNFHHTVSECLFCIGPYHTMSVWIPFI